MGQIHGFHCLELYLMMPSRTMLYKAATMPLDICCFKGGDVTCLNTLLSPSVLQTYS